MHAPEGDAGDEANQVRRGWRLGSELLRPAQVVVAKGREDGDSWR
jgi:molecular chaperone GrpE (heat shock protein)